MSVDKDTVKRIARLARIRVTEEQLESYQGELNAFSALSSNSTKWMSPASSR